MVEMSGEDLSAILLGDPRTTTRNHIFEIFPNQKATRRLHSGWNGAALESWFTTFGLTHEDYYSTFLIPCDQSSDLPCS